MKKTTQIFVIVSLIISCQKEKSKEHLILSGKIENPNTDSLVIQNSNQKEPYVIKLTDKHTFKDTVPISEGYYYLGDGKEEIEVYLKPGFDINIQLDAKEFERSITYNGKGAQENNYLAQKAILDESLKEFDNYKYFGSLEEDDYLKQTDSLYNLRLDLFNRGSEDFDKEFAFIEQNSIKYKKLRQQTVYEIDRQIVTGDKNFKVSPNYFPELYKGIELSNDKLIKIKDYIYYASAFIYYTTKEQLEGNDSTDLYLAMIENIEKKISNKKLKEELAYRAVGLRLVRTNELDKVYEKTKNLISNGEYLASLESKYQKLKKVQKGAVSPTLQLYDINENLVSLNDFRGQLVYIDIWSTHCAPCVAEIPSLNEIERIYRDKNIKFISICVGETKEGWRKFVNNREMIGIQLHAPDPGIAFFKDYIVGGIPRFILIDKEGKIIDAWAKRPSDPLLKGELDKLL